MSQVLDYSAGFPGAKAIKQAGYVGAVRYIGFADRRKCTTREELADFTSNKIGMALVFEGATTDWRGGFGAGQANGRKARDHANKIGFPAGRPIYMAVDQDVVTATEYATMIDYLRGANTSLGGVVATGVYGEADVIDRARDAGVAGWFWQTAAWSQGRRTTAHLFQHVGAVTVGGIACDINDVLTDDWGQHNYQGDGMGAVEDLQAKQVKGPDGFTRGALDTLLQGTVWAAEAIHAANDGRDAVIAAIAAIHNDPNIDRTDLINIINSASPKAADIAARLMPGLVAGVSDVIRTVVAEVLGEDNKDQAEKIVQLVVGRLAA